MRIYPHLIKNYQGKSTINLHCQFNFFNFSPIKLFPMFFFKSLIQNTYCQYKHVIFQLTQLSKPNIDLNLNAQKKKNKINRHTVASLHLPSYFVR